MFETLTIDVTNVKKILKCCPYYDDIINSDIMYNDDLSIDLIEWYKDIIFSCNGDNEEDKIIDIKNSSGTLLPETGGMGTVIFTVIAVVMILGIAVSFVISRRKRA